MCAPCYSGCVDAVRGEYAKHIAFLPFPDGPQALAEVERSTADLRVGVGAIGIAVDVNHCTFLSQCQFLELKDAGSRN